MRKKTRILYLAIITALVVAMVPITAFAGSFSSDGLTMTFPDDYVSCRPEDKITVSGVPSGWWVKFKFFHEVGGQWSLISSVWVQNTSGDSVYAWFPYGGRTGHFLASAAATPDKEIQPEISVRGKWWVTCEPPPPPPGGEGCTPGYWKNHLDSWVGYSPSDDFAAVFGVGPGITLLEGAKRKGGGENALIRHAVAGLLNAASEVEYAFSGAEVIAMVQDAYSSGEFESIKNMFESANESYCPLD